MASAVPITAKVPRIQATRPSQIRSGIGVSSSPVGAGWESMVMKVDSRDTAGQYHSAEQAGPC